MREELEICSKPKQGISIQDYIATETFFEVKKCSYEHSTKKIPHSLTLYYYTQGRLY